MEQKFLYCAHCGKIIAVVKESGVPVMCCGEKMKELEAGVSDGAKEKHVPVFKVVGNIVTVSVGSIYHPATPEHHIEWVSLSTNKGNQRKLIKAGDKPEVSFAVCNDEKVEAVYAYCNLHGLWKNTEPVAENKENDNYIVCKCKNVSLLDIEKAVHEGKSFSDIEKEFDEVKKITNASTGCGGCHDKIMKIISDIMNG